MWADVGSYGNNGNGFFSAMVDASQAMHKRPFQNSIASFVPFLSGAVLTIVGTLLSLTWLSSTISFVFIIPFVCCLTMITFFDYYGIARYDARCYYNLK